jgi:hypothetical protein
MKTILLTAAFAALVSPAFAQTTWSGTGPRGGTVQGSGSCAAGSGALNCQRSTTYTNPYGQSATRNTARVTDSTGTTRTFQTTGPRGRTASGTIKRSR